MLSYLLPLGLVCLLVWMEQMLVILKRAKNVGHYLLSLNHYLLSLNPYPPSLESQTSGQALTDHATEAISPLENNY